MSKTIKRLLFTGLFFLSAQVSALALLPNAPEQYVVVEGDTLWDISERFTQNPWHWPEIWYLNNQIDNPHLIFPGDIIGLVMVDGQTRVGIVQRGQASRTIKLSPGLVKLVPVARIEPIESAIPAIPIDAIRGFLREHRVVSEEELQGVPRILSGDDNHLVMGAGSKAYARGTFDNEHIEAYGVFRRGQLYKDPETDELLGLEALDIGLARISAIDGDIATLTLAHTNQQVNIGDLLLPTEDRELLTQFFPKSPQKAMTGRILAVSGGVSQVGQFDVVAINRGERDYLEPGDVLIIKKAGTVVYDRIANEKIRLPDERAGTMMVFRTFGKMSYALIMRTTRALKVGDKFESAR